MSQSNLSDRPNLEHLRGQAKDLLASFRSGSLDAIEAFREHLPAVSALAPDQIRERPLTLTDAQSVIARRNGFASWQKLVRNVEALRSIEGTWSFTSIVVDGMEMPPFAATTATLTIDGKNFKMVSPEATYLGFCKLNVEATPNTIDILFTEGPEAGNISLGIFEFDGRELRICLGLTGVPRPTEFVSRAGSGVALETLRRTGEEAKATEGPSPFENAEVTPDMLEGFGEMTPELEPLQGVWEPVMLTRNGMPLPKQFLAYGKREMTGAEMVVSFGGQVQVRALVKVRPTATPIEVDYLIQDGPDV